MRASATATGLLAGTILLALGGCVDSREPGSRPEAGGDIAPADSGTRPTPQTPPPRDAGNAPLAPDARVPGSMSQADGGLQRRDADVLIGSRYRPCAADADCVLVDVGCNGCCQQDAIAEQLRSAYLTEHAALCADYRGAICDCAYTPLEARCSEGQCAAVAPQPDASQTDPYALAREGMDLSIGDAYLACVEDSDCRLVGSACSCCARAAINGSLVETYLDNAELACADYEGPICDCEYVPAEARCTSNRCNIDLL